MNIGDASIRTVVVHRVGNKAREEGVILSDDAMRPEEDLNTTLLSGYLRSAEKQGQRYEFFHESDLSLNEIHTFSRKIFARRSVFLDATKSIAKHLYAKSGHPNVIGGEVLFCLIENIEFQGTKQRALGIFKIENHEAFLQVANGTSGLRLTQAVGANPRLIDKGALIFDGTDIVLAIDKTSDKAKFWVNEFLKVRAFADEKSRTLVAAKVIKNVVERIEDPFEQARLQREIKSLFTQSTQIEAGELKKILLDFVPVDAYETARESAQNAVGIQFDSKGSLETGLFQRRTSSILKKLKIVEGLDLIHSNDINVKNINVKSDRSEIQIIITIRKEK